MLKKFLDLRSSISYLFLTKMMPICDLVRLLSLFINMYGKHKQVNVNLKVKPKDSGFAKRKHLISTVDAGELTLCWNVIWCYNKVTHYH